MSNVISIKTRLPQIAETQDQEEIQVVKPKAKRAKASQTQKLLVNSAKVMGLLMLILGVTSYLVYQNYDFFNAIIKSSQALNVPALLNSIVAELILLISAAYTSARKLKIKLLAWTLIEVGPAFDGGKFQTNNFKVTIGDEN